MPWEFNSKVPVFVQIVDKIRADIINGTYPPGSQIPPVRQLAAEAAVNPNTMQRALGELEHEGLLESRGTVGRFVTENVAVIQKTNDTTKNEVLTKLVEEAEALGISDEEIIAFVTRRKAEKANANM